MSDLINIKDDRFWQILFDEACVEGEQSERIKKELEQITVEPVRGEWIPCSERLPDEEYDTVLAVTNKNHYAVYVYTTEHGFRTADIDAEGEVVAWMPLPEPYMRKKVEE